MIFLRATLREFTASGIAVLVVLLVITFTTQLIRFLGFAARGGIPADAVLTLLGFAALGYLPVLLSAALFLAVLLSMTRTYRDSEMAVWMGAGVGLTGWFRPVLLFATPVVLLVGVLSLYLTPWALGRSDEYRHHLENRDDVSAVAPGVFKESRSGDRIFYVEKVTPDLQQVSNVFVRQDQDGRESVTVARRGFLETKANGERYLVLLNGSRTEGTPGQADYRLVAFGRYAVRVEPPENRAFFPTERSLPTAELLRERSPLKMGELVWRLGLPLSALVLSLLAIPMSAVNPRTGRSLNVIMAVLVYMIYSNLISVSQSWVEQGKLGTLTGLLGVHVLMALVLAALLFAKVLPFYRRR